jgi:hypothetical protein
VGSGRENGMLCKIFSLSLPSLIESLSGLIVVSVAVEVYVCAHLLLRRLIYHLYSYKKDRGATNLRQDARRCLTEARGEQCRSGDLALQHWHGNKKKDVPVHVLPIRAVTCVATSYSKGHFCRKREVCKMQEKGGLQEAALMNPSAPSPAPQTVTESFSLVERLVTPS